MLEPGRVDSTSSTKAGNSICYAEGVPHLTASWTRVSSSRRITKMSQSSNSHSPDSRPTFIDLFAGCGGLSLGLHWAGFRPLLAVERSPMAAETYYHNHIKRIPPDQPNYWKEYLIPENTDRATIKRRLSRQLTEGVYVGKIEQLLDNHRDEIRAIIDEKAPHGVDLIAGGPPCQGFSMAGLRIADDHRNMMPKHFLDIVKLFEPKSVIIENVGGIRVKFARDDKAAVADQILETLSGIGRGYTCQMLVLNSKHYGVPQDRTRTLLVGLRNDVAEHLNLTGNQIKWQSNWLEKLDRQKLPTLAPKPIHSKKKLTVQAAFSDLDDGCYKQLSSEYSERLRNEHVPAGHSSDSHRPLNHNPRKHNEHVKERFRLYQILRLCGVDERILMEAANNDRTRVRQRIKSVDKDLLPVYSPDKELKAESHDDLERLVDKFQTNKHSQRALNPGEPSPTMLTVPDDHVHPEKARTLTVREMARLQSFPDAFEFRSKETTGGHRRRDEVPQYSQVGNAVPPTLAKSIGEHIKQLLASAKR